MDRISTESQTSSGQHKNSVLRTGNLVNKNRKIPLLLCLISSILLPRMIPQWILPSAKQQRLLVDSLYNAKMAQLKKRPGLIRCTQPKSAVAGNQ
jgi:hypothetical protein